MADITTTSPSSTTSDAAWRSALRTSAVAYIFSRMCVVVGAAIVAAELKADDNVRIAAYPKAPWADPHYAQKPIPTSAVRPILDVLTSWDGIWYLRIVRFGYPLTVRPHVTYDMPDARAAFFPAYPMLVRAVDWVLPGGDTLAALVVNFLLGGLAVWLIGLLARELFGVQVAERTMILVAMFPGSFVLSFAYTEALLMVLAAGCMWFLLKRNWWAAGVLAAVGTATRPNGVALVAACGIASIVAIRERREWRSLVAPLLSPIGFIGFQWWLGHHASEPGVWFRVQTEAWGEGTSFGFTAIRRTWQAISRPLTSPTNTITLVTMLVLVLLVWFLRRHRLPGHMVAYAAVVVLLMLLPETVTARPRFLYTAFPLFISAGAWFATAKRDWWTLTMAACGAGLVGLTALYGVLGAIP
jgi:Gpi18-like mannosyltransferase